jgi:predicted RNA-binding Zn-ribbon protein involved in translation (DUF1610 family)
MASNNKSRFKHLNEIVAKSHIADDVTMDCTKCKANIRGETLKEYHEWISCPSCGCVDVEDTGAQLHCLRCGRAS